MEIRIFPFTGIKFLTREMQPSDTLNTHIRGRAFICDPVCALPFGHNVVGLKYFTNAARPFFSEVVPLASRLLPDNIRTDYDFEAAFDFYYHKQIDLGLQHRKRGFQSPSIDMERVAAERDFAALFDRYQPNGNDAIIFPSVDYYGAIGVFAAVEKLDPRNAPPIYIRFIGVMENATSDDSPGLEIMLRRIESLIGAGYTIRVCAETPKYADYLAQKIGGLVNVVPYPPHGEEVSAGVQRENTDLAEPCSRPYTVTCPGSSRIDKGYRSLLEIFRSTRSMDHELRIRFVTQGLPIHEAVHHTQYTNQVYAVPGVKLLPSALSEQQINATYEQSDLVILPYDKEIYRYRGSAVFMECLARNVPVVALAGSAFCEQISYYGAGTVVNDIPAMVAEIIRYSQLSRRGTHTQLRQARHRYNIDASHAFASWVSQ